MSLFDPNPWTEESLANFNKMSAERIALDLELRGIDCSRAKERIRQTIRKKQAEAGNPLPKDWGKNQNSGAAAE